MQFTSCFHSYFSILDSKLYTYVVWLLFQSIITIMMVASGTINSLIDFFSFTAWIFYGSAMLALLVMRYTKPDVPRPYKVSIIILCTQYVHVHVVGTMHTRHKRRRWTVTRVIRLYRMIRSTWKFIYGRSFFNFFFIAFDTYR